MRYNISLNKWTFSINELSYNTSVTVPHTWNVDDNVMKHRGVAEYETTVFVGETLNDKKAFILFNAVYHSAKVYVNDTLVGEHSRSGYTPFKFDVTDNIIFGADNKIKVVVDNTHIVEMLPHKDDFDWADDGRIIRKCQLEFAEADATLHGDIAMWNDYRTHCGEAGEDKMRQRVHGSTDLYGNEKPSYRLLCELQG